jgi:hypothetical protein
MEPTTMGIYRKTILGNESGAALIIAMVMIIVLTVIGLASTLTSTFENRLSGMKRGSTDAFYAADSGVQIVVSKIDNFDLPGKYVDSKYNPFTDPANPNPNPTKAQVVIEHNATQKGAPRGSGFGATGALGFEHYLIDSTGADQIQASSSKPSCTVEQKVVRLVPGGE